MRHDFLDRYSRLDSPVHRLRAGTKLVAAVATVFCTVGLPPGWWTAGVAACLLFAAAMSRIPPGFLVRRLLLLEPVVLGIALLNLLQPGGLQVMASIVIKSTICLLAMILLSNTTPFSSLLETLRRWGFPALMITLFALMYRYIFVFIDEFERMRRARLSRTLTSNRRRVWHILSVALGQLFIRSTERAERVYAAMCARGWR
jgi:cobalt/nickel transport system permease protein